MITALTATLGTSRPVPPKTMTKRQKREEVGVQPTGYTIDDLVVKSGVPSRTIRFYQSKGTLHKPTIQGRLAFYDDSHLKRLGLIAQLQDRGLSIRAIKDLVRQIEAGEVSLGDWLGLEEQLQKPWANDQPKLLSQAELDDLIGPDRPGTIGDLLRSRLIERQGESYLVRAPRLLQIGIELLKNGISLEASNKASQIIHAHTDAMARELVEFYVSRLGKDFAGSAQPAEVAQALQSLRPLGTEAVSLMFGQSIEAMLRRLVESGKLTELQAKLQKRRPQHPALPLE